MMKLSARGAAALGWLAAALSACASKDSCPATFTSCAAACVDARVDRQNCGACGRTCAAGEVCSAGGCALDCGGGASRCGASCVTVASDPNNCGACGTKCAAGTVCANGACGLVCPSGTSACAKTCVDTMLSPLHCGGCDMACAAGKVCSLGKCDVSCLGGSTKCGDLCVDVKNDPGYCGDCMTACKAGEVCAAGKCAKPCSAGETLCSGSGCVDTTTNFSSCGACDKSCKAGEICANGSCIAGQPYALDGKGKKAGKLYTLDPATAKLTMVAKLAVPIVGAAFKDGVLYGVSGVGGTVWRINVATGAAKLVASTGGGPHGLALRGDGLLVSCKGSEFVTIDPASGKVTGSGVTSCQSPSAFGTDVNGAMVLVRASVLYHLDGSFNLGIVNVCDVGGDKLKGLTFHKGALYAVDTSTADKVPKLMTIDPANAKVKLVGPLATDVEALASPTP